MTDDKLFDQILARMQAREATAVALMVITTSASLVLLGITLSDNITENEVKALAILGIVFPRLAFVYNEINGYAQYKDHKFLRKIIKEEGKHADYIEILFGNTKVRIARNFVFKSVFLFDLIGWIWFLTRNSNYMWLSIILTVSGILIFLIVMACRESNAKDKAIEENSK